MIKKKLGKGSFGVVWLCEDTDNREYAIKEISLTPERKKETERELEIAKNIGNKHNGLVRIYDCFNEGESYYIVMEYCRKGSLLDFIKEKGNFQDEKVFHINWLLKLIFYRLLFQNSKRL
jgi:serine/threonine protein kinase